MSQSVSENAQKDADTIKRIAEGDREAFSAFYDQHCGLVFSVILHIVRDTLAAEDVLQEAFLQVWKKAECYDRNLGTTSAWLCTIARHKAIDHLRRARHQNDLLEQWASENGNANHAGNGAQSHPRHEEQRNGWGLMKDLPAEQREVIELAFLKGMTHEEISGLLKKPLGTIKTRIRRGLIKLRDSLVET